MLEYTDSSQPVDGTIVAEAYEGVGSPLVQLRGSAAGTAADEAMRVPETMSISLESIDVDVENQSYGMVAASTGCISNPGGPSC
ncbi:hypothetical protein [Actinomadura terrae]|uniref:hypothetical protein n=1 Tax=Actinomadura terrae TaxID=604353 RepID=UPI001FA6F056|nr:hypothetical protein [Actinomadura terrae]